MHSLTPDNAILRNNPDYSDAAIYHDLFNIKPFIAGLLFYYIRSKYSHPLVVANRGCTHIIIIICSR